MRATLALAIGVLIAVPAMSHAAPLLFDFNTVARSGNHGNGLGATGSSTSVRNYMNGVLTSNGFNTSSVSVSGALATATYNGENHVKGPTLGTSDNGVVHAGANDTFLINDNFGVYGGAANSFTLDFTNFTILSLSFDWEIFPDATCAQGSYCAGHPGSANWPDIELLVDGNAVPVWQMLATTPAGGGDPQALGTASLTFLNGVHSLTFMDWPAEVGIDNLQVGGCANLPLNHPRSGAESVVLPHCTPLLQTPEPSSLPLAALALGLATWGVGRARVTRPSRN